ncbi:MAG: fibronectin type III domain-containing protein, partial [Selenomonas sp.]|nr:fibronectin type III domain-containing protein [Selenomonas sp.]
MFTIKKILLDFMEEAAGVTSFPVLSWQFAASEKNFRQSAFQIQAAERADFTQLIYDSGEMAGKDSNGIKPHVKLKSGRRYYVRVRAAAEGKWCPWSEPVSFLTGN